ncbi:unnamed protein product [Paramecium octaurelia]|uniref:Uncharacterized protein n=1 Tax=Paramecium octaurelia TaxID=43137 RepID=A0A8S1TYZ2_PAROT|nr:unnamed protein product [Paramecium octaurelia]
MITIGLMIVKNKTIVCFLERKVLDMRRMMKSTLNTSSQTGAVYGTSAINHELDQCWLERWGPIIQTQEALHLFFYVRWRMNQNHQISLIYLYQFTYAAHPQVLIFFHFASKLNNHISQCKYFYNRESFFAYHYFKNSFFYKYAKTLRILRASQHLSKRIGSIARIVLCKKRNPKTEPNKLKIKLEDIIVHEVNEIQKHKKLDKQVKELKEEEQEIEQAYVRKEDLYEILSQMSNIDFDQILERIRLEKIPDAYNTYLVRAIKHIQDEVIYDYNTT